MEQEGVGALGAIVQSFAQRCQGRHGVSLNGIQTSAGGEAILESGIHAQQRAERGVGVGITLQFRLGHALEIEHILVARIIFQSCLIVKHGQRVAPGGLTREAAKAIGVGMELVAFHRHGGVLFGSLVILKLKLGQRTEEIGLGKIGLGLDGLVEILD